MKMKSCLVAIWLTLSLQGICFADCATTYQYKINTPERAAEEYLIGWCNKWWDLAASHTQLTWRYDQTNPVNSLILLHKNNQLLAYEITRANPGCPNFLGPSMCVDVEVKATIKSGKNTRKVLLVLRVVREKTKYRPSPTGLWGVNPVSTLKER
jgi:hypothetical protein